MQQKPSADRKVVIDVQGEGEPLGVLTSDRRVCQLQSWLCDDPHLGIKLSQLVPSCIFTMLHGKRVQWKFMYEVARFDELFDLAFDMVEGHLSPKSAAKKRQKVEEEEKVEDEVEDAEDEVWERHRVFDEDCFFWGDYVVEHGYESHPDWMYNPRLQCRSLAL
jgi:hypothetical protein